MSQYTFTWSETFELERTKPEPKSGTKIFPLPQDYKSGGEVNKGTYLLSGNSIELTANSVPEYETSTWTETERKERWEWVTYYENETYTEWEWQGDWSATRTYTDWCGNSPLSSNDRLISKVEHGDGRCTWRYQEKVLVQVTKVRRVPKERFEKRYYTETVQVTGYTGSHNYEVIFTYTPKAVPKVFLASGQGYATTPNGSINLGNQSKIFDLGVAIDAGTSTLTKLVVRLNEQNMVNQSLSGKNHNFRTSDLPNFATLFAAGTLGRSHTLEITAENVEGETGTLKLVYTRSNTAPEIQWVVDGVRSGVNVDHPKANEELPRNFIYRVNDPDGHALNVTAKLESTNVSYTLANIENAAQNQDLSFSINDEILNSLPISTKGTNVGGVPVSGHFEPIALEIAVTDGLSMSYARGTFYKFNSPPEIHVVATDLVDIQGDLHIPYTITDADGDSGTVKWFVNNREQGTRAYEGAEGSGAHNTITTSQCRDRCL